MAVLRGSWENLIDGAVSRPEEIREYYDQMLAESCHLERLVNDLLELTRLQDEGFSLEMAQVNLCDVVWDATRAIRCRAQSKEITVQTSCPDHDCIVLGDYGRFRQLLLILLDTCSQVLSGKRHHRGGSHQKWPFAHRHRPWKQGFGSRIAICV